MAKKAKSLTSPHYARRMTRARAHSHVLDAVDGGMARLPVDVQLATAMSAIEAGLYQESPTEADLDCIAQGQAILEDLLDRLRIKKE